MDLQVGQVSENLSLGKPVGRFWHRCRRRFVGSYDMDHVRSGEPIAAKIVAPNEGQRPESRGGSKLVNHFFGGDVCAVISLHVRNHEPARRAPLRFQETFRLRDRHGHRFLYENALPRIEHRDRDFTLIRVIARNHYDLDLVISGQRVVTLIKPWDLESSLHLASELRANLRKGYQVKV